MTLQQFKDSPWQLSHRVYRDSTLAMSPAPEYASSEVLLSSLYRFVGLAGATERTVPQRGRDLDRDILKARDRQRSAQGATLDADAFHTLLHSALESPKLPNQSTKRFLQVTPMVPQAATFSGSARLSSNSWPAGALVRRMVWLGSDGSEAALGIWRALYEALSVGEDDDIFARFLQREVEAWVPSPGWELQVPEDEPTLAPADWQRVRFPARRFTQDLSAIIAAKDAMTRRQWTSLLESVIRIAAVSHVAWLCDVHARTWDALREALEGRGPTTAQEACDAMYPASLSYLSYGDRALPGIKDRASAFLAARIGINALLWALEDDGAVPATGLSSSTELLSLCNIAREKREALITAGLREAIADISERETRTLLCKKGIGSNIMEFARHALGQRQAASPILRGYDQGYVLKKRGTSSASPWVVSLGPVAVLAHVHCSLAGTSGPRSVRRLSQHLAGYGVLVDHRDIAQNDLGHQLRMLGLVLDSPDAESGMLLVPPFPANPMRNGSAA